MILNKQLEGNHIVLRTVVEEDCNEAYVRWMNDFETNYYMETRWSEQTTHTIIEFVNTISKSKDSYLFAIVEKSSGIHIGNIKIGPIIPRYKYADISYFIGEKQYRGLGYAKEAIGLICDFAFIDLRLHRVQAGVVEGNISSEKTLISMGFELEGKLRHKFLREGKYLDHLIYGLINERTEGKSWNSV